MTLPGGPGGKRPGGGQLALRAGGGRDRLGAAGRVPGGPAQDVADVGGGVVPVEQRGLQVSGGAVGLEEPGGGGDGVAGVVDVGDAVAVAVDPVPAGVLGGGVDGGAAPGVAGRAADAELHRPGRPVGVGAGMHARRGRLAVVALDGPDPGEHRPRDAVPGAGFLVVGEVAGGDGRGGGAGGGRGLAGGGLLPGDPGDRADQDDDQQQHGGAGGKRDGGRAAVCAGVGHGVAPFQLFPALAGSMSQTAQPAPCRGEGDREAGRRLGWCRWCW